MTSDRRKIFLGMTLQAHTQDIYMARTSIERALRNAIPSFHGTFLDVGCGEQPYREIITGEGSRVQQYIGLDLQNEVDPGYVRVRPDLTWDGSTIPLPDGSVDSAMATEVLEHCPDPGQVIGEIHRVLRPGGVFFLTVPFLWPLHDVPYDEYRYTPFAMQRLLKDGGFSETEVQPMGGWDASLGQMIGLYVMRAPMHPRKRRVLRSLTLPLVRYLLRRDQRPDLKSNPMITGLWAIARKN